MTPAQTPERPVARSGEVEAALEWLKDADKQATEIEQGCDDTEFYASLKDPRRWCSVRGFSIAQSVRQAAALLALYRPAGETREDTDCGAIYGPFNQCCDLAAGHDGRHSTSLPLTFAAPAGETRAEEDND